MSDYLINETEIDFGATPVAEAEFTVNDSSINSNCKIMCLLSASAPTDKDQDETEMDSLLLRAVAFSGGFTLYAKAADGHLVADKFKINYMFV